jgi:hypothetical protein
LVNSDTSNERKQDSVGKPISSGANTQTKLQESRHMCTYKKNNMFTFFEKYNRDYLDCCNEHILIR